MRGLTEPRFEVEGTITMYNDYYQFHTAPFENTSDPRFFFASEQHREALAAIEYTIRMRKGFMMITGEIGAGKTTVGRTMCTRCAGQARIIQVLHGHRTPLELLRQILRSLDTPFNEDEDHATLLERLQAQLLDDLQSGTPIVLFVDEAQTLTDDALEELRLLSNLDTNTSKLIQVVLVGQPELRQRIAAPRLSPLRQRIVLAKQLRAMTIQETGAYIMHRVRRASDDPAKVGVSFTLPAIQAIYEQTRGVPRLINVTCDNCLLLGFVRETRQITPAIVARVLEDMLPSFEDTMSTYDTQAPRLSLAGGM